MFRQYRRVTLLLMIGVVWGLVCLPVRASGDAIEGAACQLFRLGEQGCQLTEIGRAERFLAGKTYVEYEVRQAAVVLGSMVRMMTYADGGCTTDTVFRLENGAVLATVDVIATKEALPMARQLTPAFEQLRPMKAERYGPALSALCEALSLLPTIGGGDVAAARNGETPARSEGTGTGANVLTFEQPQFTVGSPCPTAELFTIDGRRLAVGPGAGATVLFFGSCRDGISLEMKDVANELCSGHTRPLRFIEIYRQTVDELRQSSQFVIEASRFVCADGQGVLQTKFSIPYVPYLVAFDEKGICRVSTSYCGRGQLSALMKSFLAAQGQVPTSGMKR